MDLTTREVKGISRAVLLLASAFLLMGGQPPSSQQVKLEGAIIAAPRISPEDAHRRVAAGQALLVCAYEDEEKCGTMMLEGAMTLKAFESKLPGLTKDQPIIFYCA